MTPEEHEKYIAELERKANEALDSWERERFNRGVYPLLLLIGFAVTLWLIWKTVEAVLS